MSECKHNWVDNPPKGTYLFTPKAKVFGFRCTRCGKTTAALVKEKTDAN